jgi:hypothetical protein
MYMPFMSNRILCIGTQHILTKANKGCYVKSLQVSPREFVMQSNISLPKSNYEGTQLIAKLNFAYQHPASAASCRVYPLTVASVDEAVTQYI